MAEFVGTQRKCMILTIDKEKQCQLSAKMALFGTLIKLDHPHILKTYEVCQDNRSIYVVAETAEGGDMMEYLEKRGKLEQNEAAVAIWQVLSAVAYCHQLGVIHENIGLKTLLLKNHPKDGPFSLKLSGIELQIISNHPPSPSPCKKKDIFACGVLLYSLLSGRHPFTSSPDFPNLIPCKGFSFPPAVWSHVSPDVISLITSMLSKHPEARPSALRCLAHPWIKRFSALQIEPGPVRSSLSHLRRSDLDRSLKEVMVRFMINRVMEGSEVEKLAEIFVKLDLDGDGLISEKELTVEFRKTMSEEQAAAEASRVISKVDKNSNGQIDYTEFLLSSVSVRQLLSRGNLALAFNSLDRDGSGTITIQELKHFFRINSSPGSHKTWEEYVARWDISGDGEIDFEEFEGLMKTAFEV